MSQDNAVPYSRQEALRVVLRRVVVGLGMDLQVRIREDDVVIRGILAGPDTRYFRGHGGTALKGLQHLVERIVSRDPRFEKVPMVEIEGQREEDDLRIREQAVAAAEEARRTGKPVKLPPMNPFERRIVHLALREQSDLRTYSEGEGSERRIHVALADDACQAADAPSAGTDPAEGTTPSPGSEDAG